MQLNKTANNLFQVLSIPQFIQDKNITDKKIPHKNQAVGFIQ